MIDAERILRAATAVLLDFDGPVTPLMPAPTNLFTADSGRSALRRRGMVLPEEIGATSDPLAVIRWAGEHAPAVLADVEAACLDAEVFAAQKCVPTPGAHGMLAALHEAGVPVVIVSNNTEAAIRTYLDRHHLTMYVRDVFGRPAGHPELMKPHPHTIRQAIGAVDIEPASAVLIGDSVSDIEVARTTGLQSIGYATSPQRGDELRAAGADAITTSMSVFVPA